MRNGDSNGKATIVYTFRIPEKLYHGIQGLSPELKRRMHERMKVEMGRVVHESKYDPSVYLDDSQ